MLRIALLALVVAGCESRVPAFCKSAGPHMAEVRMAARSSLKAAVDDMRTQSDGAELSLSAAIDRAATVRMYDALCAGW